MNKWFMGVFCIVAATACAELDKAQFDEDVCFLTNKILNGWARHPRDTVYPRLTGFQKYRHLSDEDFTRELLCVVSLNRMDGSENGREKSRKVSAWRQTMLYLGMRNVPLKEAIAFYEELLLNGRSDDEISFAFSNYLKQRDYTIECFEKLDDILMDKRRRNDSTYYSLLWSMKCRFYHKLFWDPVRPSNVVSNRIVAYIEKSVRRDSTSACYFLDTLCRVKPEFKGSDEWVNHVRLILADESLHENLRKPYRDQLAAEEKRRKAEKEKKEAETKKDGGGE